MHEFKTEGNEQKKNLQKTHGNNKQLFVYLFIYFAYLSFL